MTVTRTITFATALAVVILAGVCLSGCTAAKAEKPVVIGYLGGISGRSSGLGLAGRDGALLAVEQANKARGDAKPVYTLEVADDGPGDAASVEGVRSLASKGAITVIGPMTSVSASAAVPVAGELKLPLLSPTVSSTDFTGHDDYFLRVCADNRLYASLLASRVVEVQGPAKVAVVYDLGNRSYTEKLYLHFKEALEKAGGSVVQTDTFTSGKNPDYTAIARRVGAAKPDVVLVVANAIDSAVMTQKLRNSGVDAPMALAHWAATDDLITNGGRAVEGVIYLDNYDRDSTDPAYTSMVRAFRDRFGYAPSFAAIHAYDATNMVIKAAGSDAQRASMKAALLGMGRYDGIQGPIRLDKYGDTIRPFYPMTIRDGVFTPAP